MTEITAQFVPTARWFAPIAQFGGAILDFLQAFDAARACAAAVENRARPHADDLRILGIDPKAFDKVRLL